MTTTLEPSIAAGKVSDTLADELHTWLGPAVRGDRYAIERLLALLRPVALRYCVGRLAQWGMPTASAEDVTQDVCMAVIASLHRYRRGDGAFLSYVYGIASHKVHDVRRAAARERCTLVDEVPDRADNGAGPEDVLVLAELREQLATLLETLDPRQRQVVAHRVIAGDTAPETAIAVGSTAGAVRVAQHRALARLRSVLSESQPSVAVRAPRPRGVPEGAPCPS